MKFKFLKTSIVTLILSVCCLVNVAIAGLIVDLSGGTSVNDSRDFTLGWGFTVNSSIQIDGLGLWDEDADGFSYIQGYEVGIWSDLNGALLASAIVDNSSNSLSSSSNDGTWMFTDIASLILNIGDYTIGYLRPGNTDLWRYGTSVVNLNSSITLGSRLYGSGNSLIKPITITGAAGQGYFGPNLRTVETSIPEPSTLAIFVLGMIGVASRRFKKQA